MSRCTSDNFCMQMWPRQSAAHNAMGCPRVNGQVACCILDSFCSQMRPQQTCHPRYNKQRCNILQLSAKAMLYLPSACINHTFCWQLNTLTNSLGLFSKRGRFGSQGGEIPALGHHWPAIIDLPVNSHAMHVQHTCNTRATHVQHDVQNDVQHQHEHFYCKITGKIALSRPLATNLLCFHLKAKVGLQQQETQLYL